MKNELIEHRLTAIETELLWIKKMNWVIIGGLISIFASIIMGGIK